MRLSVGFTGFEPFAPTVPIAKAAESAGLDGVWSGEHIGFHDAVVPSAVYLAETSRLDVGIVGLSPTTRHPGVLAMEIGTLSEIGRGRLRVQVGAGDAGFLSRIGKKVPRPVGDVREFVRDLRAALAGEAVDAETTHYSFAGYQKVPFGPVPPIDVMAIRPKMLDLAAEVGDGVSLSMAASCAYLRESVTRVEKSLAARGRDRSDFETVAFALVSIADDMDAARAPLRTLLPGLPQDSLAYIAGGKVDADALVDAEARGDLASIAELWTDDAIDAIGLITTPDGIAGRLADYASTGIDELVLFFFSPPDEQPALLRRCADARP